MKKNDTKKLIFLLCLCLGLWSCEDDSNFSGKDNYILSFSLIQDNVIYEGSIINETVFVEIPGNVSLNKATLQILLSENATISPNSSEVTEWTNGMSLIVTSYNNEKRVYTFKILKSENIFEGDVVLKTQKEVDEFVASGFTRINGNLTLGQSVKVEKVDSITNISGLSILTKVGQTLTVNPTYALDNLNDLLGLQRIGSLVSSGTNIKDFSLLSLKRVDNDIRISAQKAVKLDMGAMTSVGRNINFSFSDLTSLNISSLESCVGDFSMSGAKITEVLLPSLTKVGGALTIDARFAKKLDLGKLASTGGTVNFYGNEIAEINLNSLEVIGGEFRLSALNALTNISLPKLKQTYGLFLVNYMGKLTELSAPEMVYVEDIYISSLTAIQRLNMKKLKKAKDITIDSSTLTNLDTFEALTTATRIYITNCNQLTSFAGLRNVIPSLSSSLWTTQRNAYNPTYQDMVNGLYSSNNLN